MVTLEYELVKTQARKMIDLTNYKEGITKGVKEVFGQHVKVKVHADYFEFDLADEPLPASLRIMGRKISKNTPLIREHKREYDYNLKSKVPGHTTQRFVRRNK